MGDTRPERPEEVGQFRHGKFKQVRIPDWLASWAKNVAEVTNADELPDLKGLQKWMVPSRRQIVEQCLIWGLQRLDPKGEQSLFGTGLDEPE